ncbi:hypothetical protein QYE76_013177 [Lolium multiflorum]|uniref:Retrotransposon gag domain-containing protein n=1 Tax=Lolium multiflorum TaxID=4521 RepID=A0AAD8U2K4_LOLMU|nr:hypothetical protein QYE76_013177 [Lolium multiflorum]
MGAAAVMKMAVEMAAVSMEKPSGALPRSGRVPNRDPVPHLGFVMAAALEARGERAQGAVREHAYLVQVSDDGQATRSRRVTMLGRPIVAAVPPEVEYAGEEEGEEQEQYEEEPSIARGEEEQLDQKMDVKLDMELDMKTSHGRAREEREECARGEDGPAGADPARPACRDQPVPVPVPTGSPSAPAQTGRAPNRALSKQARRVARSPHGPGLSFNRMAGPAPGRPPPVPAESESKDKDAADLMTWRDFEALRNEMRREFRIEDDELRGTIDEINQKMDATNETVTAMADQMTDIQRTLQTLQLAVDNLTNQQQQQDEDPDDVPGRANRPRGWAPLGRHGRGQDEEDGLGKPKFSIPKFEGGADVEEYLTWELKIEKLWSLHPNYTEDRKIKLASSEFDGYALRWWDALVRNRQADGELPIITWRAMKEAMNARFVPTNYLRTIFDKLTLLRQGVKTVDEYYMEMEMLMQRGRVRESLEMIIDTSPTYR